MWPTLFQVLSMCSIPPTTPEGKDFYDSYFSNEKVLKCLSKVIKCAYYTALAIFYASVTQEEYREDQQHLKFFFW